MDPQLVRLTDDMACPLCGNELGVDAFGNPGDYFEKDCFTCRVLFGFTLCMGGHGEVVYSWAVVGRHVKPEDGDAADGSDAMAGLTGSWAHFNEGSGR